MIPNMKFYVISIIAIFTALGIGIYIGFTLDTNSFVIDQKEDIVLKLEERFDFLKDKNQEIMKEMEKTKIQNEKYELFISSTYQEMIINRLEGMKIAIIESKGDYVYPEIEQILNIAGANITSTITINDNIINKDTLNEVYDELQDPIPEGDVISDTSKELIQFLVSKDETKVIKKLMQKNIIDVAGNISQPFDCVIVAGESTKKGKEKMDLICRILRNITEDILVVGVEKINANYSYISTYKDLKISTIDNIDTLIGKISLIYTLEGRPGHYGSKTTAEEAFPSLNSPISKQSGER